MDILDILLDILLKPPQPFIGLFLLLSFDRKCSFIGVFKCTLSNEAVFLLFPVTQVQADFCEFHFEVMFHGY